ncbi:M23 family metallopeptidase [archaeon]|nr:M23 family metallopeptidase [archaeon]
MAVTLKHWPAPDSFSKNIPATGSAGSFWEDRGDRRHCGIDIYAPAGSAALAIEDGEVRDVGTFTTPEKVPYWNDTKYVLIENKTGLVCRYAELGQVAVEIGDQVKAGQLIGHIGIVLDMTKITSDSPLYIQKLTKKQNLSMLHFELYSSLPDDSSDYLGGNWFGDLRPENLLNPGDYLSSIG